MPKSNLVIKKGESQKSLENRIANHWMSTEGQQEHAKAMDLQKETQRSLNQEVFKGGGYIENDQAQEWVDRKQDEAPAMPRRKRSSAAQVFVLDPKSGRLVPEKEYRGIQS